MKDILKLNEISGLANKVFDGKFNFTEKSENPIGIMLRSFNLHDFPLPDSLLAIARAGAGVNNIPVEECAEKGIVVFNTPGANANAVKELTICAILLASRKIAQGYVFAQSLKGSENVAKRAEKGKSAFVGPEIYGKKILVMGLGAIGSAVANACVDLGMEVSGYDPFISVDAAWRISRSVKHVTDLYQALPNFDYITLHVPYTGENKGLVGKEFLGKTKDGVRIINLSRGELCDNEEILEGTANGRISAYVTDFAKDELLGKDNIVVLPHLGASTPEAEDNCAYNAAKALCDYLENGNIKNSVNFPSLSKERCGEIRITVIHKNVKSILSKITSAISESGANIANLINSSRNEYAYTIVDCDDVEDGAIERIRNIDGVIKVRKL